VRQLFSPVTAVRLAAPKGDAWRAAALTPVTGGAGYGVVVTGDDCRHEDIPWAFRSSLGQTAASGSKLCRQLQQRGETVIAICRKSSRELEELGVRVESGIDVTDDRSLSALSRRLDEAKIDLLVNNAGIGEFGGLDGIDFASVQRQIEVNAIGPLRVTNALLPRLRQGGKVAIITSRMGSIADNTSGGLYGYRMSKAAVNAAGVSLAHDLRGRGVAVALLHPGMVSTEMTGGQGVPPAVSVRGLLARIEALTLATSGHFWHATTGEELPW
jgi:NAD(P)-dependent dehydrogenase (short-subunit alcohol dehydrogenase family)